ncbi:MAG: hypothetical protein AAF542_01215 [Pseudomonadota bacterium]
MIRKTLSICIFFGATLIVPIALSESAVSVMTEATPFTLQTEPVTVDGEATVFVKRVLERAQINYELSFIPWKRSYRYAQTRDNILIYPIARTKARSKDFIWIGKIIPINYYLFKLRERSDLKLASIDDARSLSIGVVNDHVHHEYLVSEGFSNIQPVNSSAQNLRKLLRKRIDLFPISAGGLLPLCAQISIDCKLLEPALALEDFSDGLYMAYSKNSDPHIVLRTQRAYEALIDSDFYRTLFSTRLANASLPEATLQLPQEKPPP